MDFTKEFVQEQDVDGESAVQTWVVKVHVSSAGYAARTHGPPEDCHPGSGPEFEIVRIRCRETKQEIDEDELFRRLSESYAQDVERVRIDVYAELSEAAAEAVEDDGPDEDAAYDAWRDREDDPDYPGFDDYDGGDR